LCILLVKSKKAEEECAGPIRKVIWKKNKRRISNAGGTY
jgi:hypothetical protein